jgi:tRNA threonylcarbamoyladenosine modification (KEOPS) complex Cgi121 subunit
MKNSFNILKKSYYIENIHCSIDISNIEKYLKRIVMLEKDKKGKNQVILVPDTLVYSENQLNWAIYNAKSRFLDKINISKSLFTETLMILSFTNQIKGIGKEWFLKEGKNNCYLSILSEEKINSKEIVKELEFEVIKEKPILENKKIIDYYKIKNKKNIENEILEKMALSLF